MTHHLRSVICFITLVMSLLFGCKKEQVIFQEDITTDKPIAKVERPRYQFQAFDAPISLGYGTTAYDISNGDVIIGNFVTNEEGVDGFIYEAGNFTAVGVPGADPSNRGILIGVNDDGVSVGSFNYPLDIDPNEIVHSFLRLPNGTITILPDAAPGATSTEAHDINLSGKIVGVYNDASFNRHGFIYWNGIFTTYDSPGAIRTLLTGINNQDQIVGFFRNGASKAIGFVLEEGVAKNIVYPGAVHTRPFGINDGGDIVGEYIDRFGVSHGFVKTKEGYQTLDFPGAFDTVLLGINNNGTIVGTYDGYSHGLIATPN